MRTRRSIARTLIKSMILIAVIEFAIPRILRALIPGGQTWVTTLLGAMSLGMVVALIARSMTADDAAEARVREAQGLITDPRQAAERIAASEQRFRTIVNAEPECVKIMSLDGTLQEMNPAGLAVLEAESIEQVREVGLDRFVLPEHRSEERRVGEECRSRWSPY